MSAGSRGSSEAEAGVELASALDMAPKVTAYSLAVAWRTGVLESSQGFGVSISSAGMAASL